MMDGELFDLSQDLEEEALILALFGQAIWEGNGISAPKEVQARLLCRLSDYLNQRAADLKSLCRQKNSPYDCVCHTENF